MTLRLNGQPLTLFFFGHGSTAPVDLGLLCEVLRSLSHTHTLARTPLDEWSARGRDLYLTTHNNHKRHSCPWRIRTRNPSKAAAAGPRLRQRGILWLIKQDIKCRRCTVVMNHCCLYRALRPEEFPAPSRVYGIDIPWPSHLLLPSAREQNDSVQAVLTTRLHFQRVCLHCGRPVM